MLFIFIFNRGNLRLFFTKEWFEARAVKVAAGLKRDEKEAWGFHHG